MFYLLNKSCILPKAEDTLVNKADNQTWSKDLERIKTGYFCNNENSELPKDLQVLRLNDNNVPHAKIHTTISTFLGVGAIPLKYTLG